MQNCRCSLFSFNISIDCTGKQCVKVIWIADNFATNRLLLAGKLLLQTGYI